MGWFADLFRSNNRVARRDHAKEYKSEAKRIGFNLSSYVQAQPARRIKMHKMKKSDIEVSKAKIETTEQLIREKESQIEKVISKQRDHEAIVAECKVETKDLSKEIKGAKAIVSQEKKAVSEGAPMVKLMGYIVEEQDEMYKFATMNSYVEVQNSTGLTSLKDVQDRAPGPDELDELLGELIAQGLENFKHHSQGEIKTGHFGSILQRQMYVCELLDIKVLTEEEADEAALRQEVNNLSSPGGKRHADNEASKEGPLTKKSKMG